MRRTYSHTTADDLRVGLAHGVLGEHSVSSQVVE